MNKQTFINNYKQDFVDACFNTGLFPSVAMAQAILESGWGESLLSKKYFSFFGIKAEKGYLGNKVLLDSAEGDNKIMQKSYFRVYSNFFDSLVDRNNFLKEQPRYTKYGVFKATTPEEQAKALQAAGYAQNSNYANQIITIINDNNLKEIDKLQPNKFRTTTQTKAIILIAILAVASIGGIYYFTHKN